MVDVDTILKGDPLPPEERPSRCEGCPYLLRMTCGSRGPQDAPVVVVAESPGDLEEKYGFPLIGPSGRLLESALPPNAPPILYLNAIQCFPGPSGKKDQSKLNHAVFQCRSRLMNEILAYERDMILVLGKFAAVSLTGNSVMAITKIRGQSKQLLYGDVPLAKNGVFFSVHPSYLLHGGGNANIFYKDISRALARGTTIGTGASTDASTGASTKKVRGATPIICNSLHEWLLEIGKYDIVAADIETTGFDHQRDDILWLGGYGGKGDTHYYAVSGGNINPLFYTNLWREYKLPKFIWQNGKFDRKFLRRYGLDLAVDEDTMLQSYVLNEQQGNHDLDSIALHYAGLEPHKDMVSAFYKKGKTLADAPQELVLDYLGKDLQSTYLVYMEMEKLIEQDLSTGYYGEEWNPNLVCYHRLLDASNMLTNVEENGIGVDLDVVKQNADELSQTLVDLEGKIFYCTKGLVSSPGSTEQVQHYLFDVLGLPMIKESSDRETLERLVELKGENEFISLMLAHRRAAKLYGTYVKNVHNQSQLGKDGRIHSTFLLHGTVTGRLASRNPNVENIPREGRIRNQFCSSEGRLLLGIDLNQAELRALACLSEDPSLIDIYSKGGRSLHDVVSEWLFGDGWDSTPTAKAENKIRTKALNFGIVYGRSGADIAREFKLPKEAGLRWVDWWFSTFPKAKEFLDMCSNAPLVEQTIVSPFGNKKRPKIVSRRSALNVQNQAKNFLPQNVASNLILDATTKLWDRHQVRGDTSHVGWDIVNLIHDETLFEVDSPVIGKKLFKEFSQLIHDIAEERLLTQVPFVCEAKIGTHWGSLEEQDWS